MVHIQPPYRHGRGVATYLARYARGGPLKNHQILAFDGRTVRFRYKESSKDGSRRRWREMTLRVDEFLRRLLLHVPPPGLARGPWLRALCPQPAPSSGERPAPDRLAAGGSDRRGKG